jgi:murein DD-endopeptidase MepM/ murein hydrolase activator NlpD
LRVRSLKKQQPDEWGQTIGDKSVDVASITFLLFTLFSSLRVVSYVPQIHKVALDCNGASAISYSTWSLWTCANIATALYAAINLRDAYLSAVSGIYAVCCVVVIALTMLKRRRLRSGGVWLETNRPAGTQRTVALEALRGVVDEAGAALLEGRRPSHAFERDIASLSRRILWSDIGSALRSHRTVAFSPTARERAPGIDGGKQAQRLRRAGQCAFLAVVVIGLMPPIPALGCELAAHEQSPIELRKPVIGGDARLAAGFGIRVHPLLQIARLHTGVDWAAPLGTPVVAAGRGRVVAAGVEGQYGNRVIIDHGGPWRTLYAQLSAFSVKEGDCVQARSLIGSVGATGLATGPHLHFEVLRYGKPVDPMLLRIN